MQAVFHHSNDENTLQTRVVNNIANLLNDETIDLDDVVLVTNSGGLQLVLEDSPERERVVELLERGVTVKQCQNTIEGTDVTAADLIDGVELVPSGVGELTRLQNEGYAYLVP
ncbi:DsrE family protein [Halarchaeum sp. P4]|uniref:DsrE family protein n=1 Tax=Halarchaeum sp. P4 TaxID=3421639 RepID=UPI003EBA841E